MKANKILLLICLFVSSCAPTRKTEIRDKLHFINQTKRDSLVWIIKDSVHIQTRNDTVFVDRWHTQWRDREVIKNDTIWLDDTVYVEKEKDLSLKEKIQLKAGEYSIYLIIFALLYFMIRKKIKAVFQSSK